MGQKVHPIGFRLGYIKDWNSRWFAKKDYAELFHEDLQLRKFIKEKLYHAGIGRVEIERAAKQVRVNVYTARPGIIIGKKGSEIDKLKADIQNKIKKNIYLNIREIRKAEMDAQLIAENVALQLERRVAFRRAMKKSVASALRFGAKGI